MLINYKKMSIVFLLLTICLFLFVNVYAEEIQVLNGKYSFIEPQYDDVGYHFNNLITVKKNGKWGVIDEEGNVVIKPDYEEITFGTQYYKSSDNEFLYVKKNTKWGVMDKSGKTITEAVYDKLDIFSEGLLAIKINDKWGYLNEKGEIAILPQFEEANRFRNGFATVKKENLYCVINKHGDIVIKTNFDWIDNFSEFGLAQVEKGNKYGVIDTKGNIILQPKYDGCSIVNNNFIKTYDKGKYGFINLKNKVMIEPKYDNNPQLYFVNGNLKYAFVKIEAKKFARLIDENGKEVLPFDLEYVTSSKYDDWEIKNDHYFPLVACQKIESKDKKNKTIEYKYYFINEKGKIQLQFTTTKWISIDIFKNYAKTGLIPFCQNNKFGFIDINNYKIIIKPQYDDFSQIGEGALIPVLQALKSKNFVWKFIDKKGKVIVDNLHFDHVSGFKKNIALVENYQSKNIFYGFINKKGKLIASIELINNFEDYDVISNFIIVYYRAASQLYYKMIIIENNSFKVIQEDFLFQPDFYDDILIVMSQKGKWGIIDKTGKWIVEDKYDIVTPFYEDVSIIIINDKCGAINKRGIFIVDPKYEKVEDKNRGSSYLFNVGELYAIKLNGKYGFIDKKANIVYRPQFDEIKYDFEFDNLINRNIVAIKQNSKWGFIVKKNLNLQKK